MNNLSYRSNSVALNDGSNTTIPLRILRLHQVMTLTGLGKTSIYQLQAQHDFPMSVQLTATAVGWIEHEIQDWLAQRVARRMRKIR
jgi:prophage regulatory protein